jgi:4-hydroxy-tetrahydrodipicolinate synthase
MNPAAIRAVFEGWDGKHGAALQAKADRIRQIFQAVPMIPAMKRVVAEFSGQKEWAAVRPPLTPLTDAVMLNLTETLRSAEFDMPGYPAA